MKQTKLTITAINIAYKAHLNVKEQGNLPKIYKVFTLANNMETEYEFCVALLYDALLDKKTTLNKLKKDFPFEVTDALFILIPDDSLAYPDYIRRIKTNKVSTKVKIAELEYELVNEQANKNKVKQQQNIEKINFALNILKK